MLHKGVQYVLYKPEWLGIFTMARYIYNGWSLYSHINIRIKIKIISGISDLKDSLQKIIDIRSLNIIIIITVEPVLMVTCEGRSPCIRRSVRKDPTEFSMCYIHIEHLYKQATCI